VDLRVTILCPILRKIQSIFYDCICRESKKHHWKYNRKFWHKDVSPYVSKVLGDLTNIWPKQSTKIRGKKENGRVMFCELLPHTSIGKTFIPIHINTRNHD
jgi:hypothetical protein